MVQINLSLLIMTLSLSKLRKSHVIALESVIEIPWNRRCKPVFACSVAQLGILRALHLARGKLGVPLGLCNTLVQDILQIPQGVKKTLSRRLEALKPDQATIQQDAWCSDKLRVFSQTYHLQTHDLGMNSAVGVLFGGTQGSRATHAHEGRAERHERMHVDHGGRIREAAQARELAGHPPKRRARPDL